MPSPLPRQPIPASSMVIGIRYVVTQGSVDGEFQPGDKIILYPDGDIGNISVAGWMPAEDVPEATRGMLCKPHSGGGNPAQTAQASAGTIAA